MHYVLNPWHTGKMNVDLPSTTEKRLAQQASDAGYDDVATFVADHLTAIASHPLSDEFAPLSDAELAASLTVCDESMTQIDRGEGLPVAQAHRLTVDELRQSTP